MMEQLFSPDGFDDPGSGPLYLQLQRRIAEAIASGRLVPGDSLPAERDMATMTGLSRVTVRNAIQALVASGQLVQRRGSGTFVAQKVERLEQALSLRRQPVAVQEVFGQRPALSGIFISGPQGRCEITGPFRAGACKAIDQISAFQCFGMSMGTQQQGFHTLCFSGRGPQHAHTHRRPAAGVASDDFQEVIRRTRFE